MLYQMSYFRLLLTHFYSVPSAEEVTDNQLRMIISELMLYHPESIRESYFRLLLTHFYSVPSADGEVPSFEEVTDNQLRMIISELMLYHPESIRESYFRLLWFSCQLSNQLFCRFAKCQSYSFSIRY